jgi:hypothetical protein
MTKLSEASVELARARPRAFEQPELPAMPAPMTENRSRDFGHNAHPPCKRCQVQCDYCIGYMADHAVN